MVKRIVVSLVIAAIALTIVTGCGKRGHTTAASGGKVFRYALSSAPTTFDPAKVEDGDTIDLLMQVFNGLVQWDENNKIVPDIAQSWDLSTDGRTYTFHLRDNVRFHNGRKVTAQDFVYSLNRVLAPATASTTAMTYLDDIVGARELNTGKAATLAGVKAIDDKTLQVSINGRKPYFLGKLTYPTAYVVCKEAIEKNGGQLDDKAAIGAGPFKLADYKQGYRVTLTANADYYGGRPIIDGIERPVLPDPTTRQTSYESGQLDIVDVERADLSRLRKDPELSKQLKVFPRAALWYLALNQKAFAPFRDKRVRQAFASAIDKDAIVQQVFLGTAQRANGVIPPGIAGYDEKYPGITYDPAKAKQLLAQAGYPDGKGFPRLVISFRQGSAEARESVIAMRDYLKKNLNIDVDMQQVEWSQFLNQRNQGVMPCYHLRWSADYLDAQDFLSVLLHTGSAENGFGYSNPQFDALCDRADVEPDSAKRVEMYKQAERMAIDDSPWVSVYFQQDIELHKPYVKGLRMSLMGHLPHTKLNLSGR